MQIEGRIKNSFHVIDIKGKISDYKDSIYLKTFMKELFQRSIHNVALNLSNVTYVDSSALNVIIYCCNVLLKNNEKLVLINPSEYVRDVIEVVGVDKIAKVYYSEEEFENDYALI